MTGMLELSPAARICRDSLLMFGTLVLATVPPTTWLPWAWLPMIGLNLILLRQMVCAVREMQREAAPRVRVTRLRQLRQPMPEIATRLDHSGPPSTVSFRAG